MGDLEVIIAKNNSRNIILGDVVAVGERHPGRLLFVTITLITLGTMNLSENSNYGTTILANSSNLNYKFGSNHFKSNKSSSVEKNQSNYGQCILETQLKQELNKANSKEYIYSQKIRDILDENNKYLN